MNPPEDETSPWAEEALCRARDGLKRAARRLAQRAFPGLAVASLQMEGGVLHAPAIPQIFSRNLREITPTLNDDLLDLYGRAEQTLGNQFTLFNHSEQFGEEIGWERHPSPAWRGELHSFDYGLDLAITFRISRDERYARHLRYLIADWIAANPPFQGAGWQPGPLARRVRNWILAADLAREDWESDPGFLDLASQSLALQSASLFHGTSFAESFYDTLDRARALRLAGKFFAGYRGREFRAKALSLVLEALQQELRSDGFTLDARPSAQLHWVATLTEFLVLEEGGKRDENQFLITRLRQALSALEAVLLPGGLLPSFGPRAGSYLDTLADVFALAAVVLKEPVWKSLAEKFGIFPYLLLGEEGKNRFESLPSVPWTPTTRSLSESRLFRLVGADSSVLVVNGGAPRRTDHHQDQLTYELCLKGHRVVVDSGAHWPEETYESFRSAAAHNVLLVDGRGSGSPILPAQTPFEAVVSEQAFTGLTISGQDFNSGNLKHRRSWFSLDAPGWLVLDRLMGSGRHRLLSLLHFFPPFELQLFTERAVARSRALTVTVIPVGQAPTRMAPARGANSEFPGWYSPDFGVKYPAAVLALEWDNADLPWAGGYLIVPGEEVDYEAPTMCGATGKLTFRLSRKLYGLPLE